MAVDDPDFQPLFENKENEGPLNANSIHSNDSCCKSSPESEDDSFCGDRTDSSLICREDVILYDAGNTLTCFVVVVVSSSAA